MPRRAKLNAGNAYCPSCGGHGGGTDRGREWHCADCHGIGQLAQAEASRIEKENEQRWASDQLRRSRSALSDDQIAAIQVGISAVGK